MVLEHHMMRCALDDPFELYEFPNDLARWCWDALGDRVLAEQLGLVDPYQLDSLSALRAALVNVLEEDRKSTRLNSSHLGISYAVFCLKKKRHKNNVLML